MSIRAVFCTSGSTCAALRMLTCHIMMPILAPTITSHSHSYGLCWAHVQCRPWCAHQHGDNADRVHRRFDGGEPQLVPSCCLVLSGNLFPPQAGSVSNNDCAASGCRVARHRRWQRGPLKHQGNRTGLLQRKCSALGFYEECRDATQFIWHGAEASTRTCLQALHLRCQCLDCLAVTQAPRTTAIVER